MRATRGDAAAARQLRKQNKLLLVIVVLLAIPALAVVGVVAIGGWGAWTVKKAIDRDAKIRPLAAELLEAQAAVSEAERAKALWAEQRLGKDPTDSLTLANRSDALMEQLARQLLALAAAGGEKNLTDTANAIDKIARVFAKKNRDGMKAAQRCDREKDGGDIMKSLAEHERAVARRAGKAAKVAEKIALALDELTQG